MQEYWGPLAFLGILRLEILPFTLSKEASDLGTVLAKLGAKTHP